MFPTVTFVRICMRLQKMEMLQSSHRVTDTKITTKKPP